MPSRTSRIPVYDLYAAPNRDPVPGFLHIERVPFRARQHGWSIESHRHADLHQAFLVTREGGQAHVDGEAIVFEAPWLLWIPAGHVHGFTFRPGTDGHVLTIAADFLEGLGRREGGEIIRGTIDMPVAASLPQALRGTSGLEAHFQRIAEEIGGEAPGSRVAAAAHLELILVALARIGRAAAGALPGDRHAALFDAFRRAVERHFREHRRITDYARELGVTRDRLHDIATRIAGRPALSVVHDRVLLEARRALVYTNASVAEIGFDLGFRDPAYFSRFFQQRVGVSPSEYRAAPAKEDQV